MQEFQLDIIRWIQQFMTPTLNRLAETITMIGEEQIVIALLAIIYLAINKKAGQKLIYIIITSMIVNATVKNIIRAPRPIGEEGIISIREETAGGYSFPSGHTQNTATFFMSLAILFRKSWFYVVTGILIFLVALSRLYLGVHYPLDVIVGAALGIGIAFGGVYLFDHYQKHRMLLGITSVVFLPMLVYLIFFGDALADDFFKMYGLLVGYLVAFSFEKKFVNFSLDVSILKKALRVIVGLALVFGLQTGLKMVFPDALIFHFIRYFLIAFVGLGCYPWLFKKLRC